MAIPEAQLSTWSNPGAQVSAQQAHASIRTALSASTSPIRDRIAGGEIEIYLQGSYRNHTNIRGDSDVDVVVELNSTISYDISALPATTQTMFRQAYPFPTYTWQDFRGDVLTGLQRYYGLGVNIAGGKKAIKVPRLSGRVAADVIVALKHHEFSYFIGPNTIPTKVGIGFWTQPDSSHVINFPRQHGENGEAKNFPQRTASWFKQTVRVFKNARTYLVERGRLDDNAAPSYFVECLLYNVPDSCFGRSNQETFIAAYNWLSTTCNSSALVCQNEQMPLFGNLPEQWTLEAASRYLLALKELWNNW